MIVALVIALQAHAAPPLVQLTKPALTVDADFTQIRGIRELPDGRVLVSDRVEQKVFALNPRTGATQAIGRIGSGPAEYRLPAAIYALPGDSSLLVDEGNSRIILIGPDLRILRTFALQLPGLGVPLGARGRDASGRFVLQVPSWLLAHGPLQDSVSVVRFDERSSRVDTVARIKGATPPPHAGYSPVPQIPMVIFAPQDVYAVAADGYVAIVRSSDFHVEWVAPNGTVTRGAPVPHEAMPVTAAEKTAHARRFMERSSIGGKDPGGGMTRPTADMMTPAAIARLVAANTYATIHAPFGDAAPIAAPDGSLWVERTVALGAPLRYDVFNRQGNRVRTVQLAPGRRLAGLGKQVAYVIVEDADGLEHLELYSIT